MKISTLRTRKFGAQSLLVEWRATGKMSTTVYAAIVLPEQDDHPGFRLLTPLQFPTGGDDEKYATELLVMERAVRLLALREAEALSANQEHRTPVEVEPLDQLTVRAARSLGHYPGLYSLANNASGAREGLGEFEGIEFTYLSGGRR